MAIVKVDGLTKSFKGVKALDGVRFEFESGILSFLGPSGCGKTTLLRCIAGLEIPDEGTICIEDEVQTSIERGSPGPVAFPKDRIRLPELRPLAAHERLRQRRLRPAAAEGPGGAR